MSRTSDAVNPRVVGGPNLRAGVVYAGASVVQRLMTLALLPIYTRILVPSAYGQLSIILSVAIVGTFLFSFGLDTAVLRAWFTMRDDPSARAAWIGSVGVFMGVAPVVSSGIASLILWSISDSPLGVPIGWMTLGIMGSGLGATATLLPQALLRAQERVRDYVALNVLLAVVNTGSTLLFMLVFRWGVAGWLAGTLLGYAVCLAAAFRLVPWPAISRSTFDGSYVKEALTYGVPLVPHLLSQWALLLADRVVLVGLVTKADLGRYTLASNLTLPILVVATGFTQSSMPTFAHFSVGGQATATVRRMVTQLAAIICGIGIAAGLLLPVGIREALPSSYYPAAALCGWLALGFTLAGLYQIPMNTISLIAGRTRWVWIITLTAATVNILLLYIWVPTGGIRAAAIATAIAFALLFIGVSAYSVRLVGSSFYSIRRLLTISLGALALYFGGTLAIPNNSNESVGLSLAWVMASLLLLALAAGFTPPPQLRRLYGNRS
jgi:O-antigen/teichoic acid export membrane protein